LSLAAGMAENEILCSAQWDSTFFAFSLIIEGTTEKVLKLMVSNKKNY
jgi:hypothetical protein